MHELATSINKFNPEKYLAAKNLTRAAEVLYKKITFRKMSGKS